MTCYHEIDKLFQQIKRCYQVKCCGKNVRFTPRNITANLIFSHLGFIFNPVNKGYH
jgi:hypothetical protein